MGDLKIELDNPSAVYIPGQKLSGKVIIKNQKPIKARFLKICIHGNANTAWLEQRPLPFGAGFQTSSHSATKNYLTGETIAWSSENGTNEIPAGTSFIAFRFDLPVDCPPSYKGSHGWIRYSISVKLDRPGMFNNKSYASFSVAPQYDVMTNPTAMTPIIGTVSKTTGLLSGNRIVKMTINLPKHGYVPGEDIPITVDIDNGSKSSITAIRTKLCQLARFQATQGNSFSRENLSKLCVVEAKNDVNVASNTKNQVLVSMKIPTCIPTFECSIIQVGYYIAVTLETSSTLDRNVKVKNDVIIGTISPTDQPSPAVL